MHVKRNDLNAKSRMKGDFHVRFRERLRVKFPWSTRQRFIRPLAGERKNSLFFGSDRMAHVSAVYHTIISTCKMQGVSVLDYFKRFFSEIVKGRRDYEHLLPLTIGLEQ